MSVESGLPAPSATFAIIAAALIEHEKDQPGFIERVQARLQGEANIAAAVRLRGPRCEPSIRAAFEEAVAWTAALAPVAAIEAPPPAARKKRWSWL
jgi:hypothetical protein